jgi:hypothetical protein
MYWKIRIKYVSWKMNNSFEVNVKIKDIISNYLIK